MKQQQQKRNRPIEYVKIQVLIVCQPSCLVRLFNYEMHIQCWTETIFAVSHCFRLSFSFSLSFSVSLSFVLLLFVCVSFIYPYLSCEFVLLCRQLALTTFSILIHSLTSYVHFLQQKKLKKLCSLLLSYSLFTMVLWNQHRCQLCSLFFRF